jgi:O-antigen ligase
MVRVSTLGNMNPAVIGNIGRPLAWTAGIATLMVLPDTSYDPINVPKLLIIAVGGFAVLGVLITQRKTLLDSRYRPVLIFGVAFFLNLLVVLIVSGTNFSQEFFGTFGRSTGFVAYASLTFLLLAAALVADQRTFSKVAMALVVTGGASIIYGLLQSLNADPADWVSQYNPVVGFLGNPNFQSSFVGFNGVLVFALILNTKYSLLIRFLLFLDLLLSTYVIRATDSQQGFLVLMGGISIVGIAWIRHSKFKSLSIPAFILGTVGAIFVTLGSINSGPLASLLYKASVTYRGDYWRAGWKMTLENPFFGVGLDSYGDWYRRARTVEATLRRGPEITSNAAHNVLIDFSSNGGFPLVLIYISMLVLAFISSIKVLRRTQSFNPFFTGLFAVWIAYQAQSIISLNQIGLAVWGWIISGLLIGYEINTRIESDVVTLSRAPLKGKTTIRNVQQRVSAGVLIAMFSGGLVGMGLGTPPIITSTQFVSALKSKDAILIQEAAYVKPVNSHYVYLIIEILAANKLMSEAIEVSDISITKFRNDYKIWKVRSTLEGLNQAEIERALREMKRLDPNNPNLK